MIHKPIIGYAEVYWKLGTTLRVANKYTVRILHESGVTAWLFLS